MQIFFYFFVFFSSPWKAFYYYIADLSDFFFYCWILVGVSTKNRHWELIQNNCYKRIQPLICCRTLFIRLFIAMAEKKRMKNEWHTCLVLMSGTNASNRKASVNMNTRAIICQGQRLQKAWKGKKYHRFKKEMRDLPFDVEGWSEFQRSEKFSHLNISTVCYYDYFCIVCSKKCWE